MELGNPEGYTNVTGHQAIDKRANMFLDSAFYQDVKNTTILHAYEAVAFNDVKKWPDASQYKNATEYTRVVRETCAVLGRVIYSAADARIFVTLHFIASLIYLATACVCFDLA